MDHSETSSNLTLLLASANEKKRRELERCLEGSPYRLRSLAEFSEIPVAPEDGDNLCRQRSSKSLVLRPTDRPVVCRR